MSEALHPQLAGIVRELELVTGDVRRLAGALDDAGFARRPAPDRWSPAECVEHLTITTAVYVPILRDGITRARALPGARGRYRSDLKGWLLARSLEPGARFRITTPAKFEPRGGSAKGEVVAAFARSQETLAALVRESSGLDLRRTRIASPFNPRLTYNLYAGYRVLAAHQRRHLAQARAAAG